jgi:predicted aldo/keto reductase-like oxidoreductase
MEPLRGGRLTQGIPESVRDIWESAEQKRSPAEWGLRWVMNHPEVSVVLSGMSNMEQLRENLRIAEDAGPGKLTTEEIKIIGKAADEYRRLMKIDCTGCAYCMPCPNGVNIPMVFSLYNDYYLFNDEEFCSMMYNAMIPPDQNAANCVECGECEEKCPQHIEIIENLREAHKTMYREDIPPARG